MLRYSFGPFELDPDTRLLRRDGEPVPMAARTFDTLVILVENRGRLVDKEELLSRVWAGNVVEEANLTQAIFTVRKILGDSPKDHRYIATVAGRGYRFVAPIAESTTTTRAAGSDLNKPWRFGVTNRLLRFGIAGVVIAVLAGIAFWLSHDSVRDTGFADAVPFTSSAGFAEAPEFSPDGNQIAYSWNPEGDANSSVYVKLIGAGTALRLTRPPGSDTAPAWSPDGRYIAFYRNLRGRSGYYLVSVLGGPVRSASPGGVREQLSWRVIGRHCMVS